MAFFVFPTEPSTSSSSVNSSYEYPTDDFILHTHPPTHLPIMGKSFLLVAFLLLFISIGANIVRADEPKKTPAPVPASKDQKPPPAPKDKDDKPKPDPKDDEPKPAPKQDKPKPDPKDNDDKPKPDPEENKPKPAPKEDKPKPDPKDKDDKPKPAPKEDNPKPKPKPTDDDVTNYDVLEPEPKTGRQRAYCKSKGACNKKTLTCPAECPERKPKANKKQKGCFVHCGSKCEATCKWRRAQCNGYGSLCYDPRFVGGDGVMFYFHGSKGHNFALVSDTNLQINAHFIGNRPTGRSRDYTWVQAISVMFDTHNLLISAKKVPQWDDSIDVLLVKWDGQEVTVPFDGEAEWKTHTGFRRVVVERTDDTNSVRLTVGGLVEIDMKAVPVTKEDDKAHNYQIPANDAFAHFETQFRFSNLSENVEGILGKTYRPGYVSPVKRGVAMPMMGGEDKYETPSLSSPNCKVCMFQKEAVTATANTGLADF